MSRYNQNDLRDQLLDLEDSAPWEDTPSTAAATTSATSEDTAMTTQTAAVATTDTLDAFFSQLGQYPRQNVLERLIQTLVSESARAAHFADRIEFGDDAMHACGEPLELDEAGFVKSPVDLDIRPEPDTAGVEPRRLSEKQFELLNSLRDDEVAALEMVSELADVFRAICGDEIAFSTRRTEQGRYEKLTKAPSALNHEYQRAHAAWLGKLARDQDAQNRGFNAAGSESLTQQTRRRRASVIASL